MLVTYYRPPEYYSPESDPRPGLFFAGGITGVEDWQAEALQLVKDSGRTVAVISPRCETFDFTDPAAGWNQVCWEQIHLHLPDMHTMFWFPKSDRTVTTQPIAMFELGQALGEGRDITVGADPDYPRQEDVEMLCRLNAPSLTVHRTLADTVAGALGKLS